MNDTPRERLARLEEKVTHLEATVDKMDAKLTEVHELLMQAKGVRWFVIGMAGVAGFFASFLPKFWTFVNSLPR